MDKFINKEIDDLINGVGVGPFTSHLNDKIKKQDFSSEMIKVNKLYDKIINNTEYLKCLLVLSLKKVTWKRELRDKFDCGKTLIDYFINYMKYNGFIITRQLIDIDDILFETIIRTNSNDFYMQSHKVNLVTLTPSGEEFCKRVLEDCIKLQREDIIFTIQEINNKTQSFRIVYNNLMKLENKISYSNGETHIIDGFRYIKYPDGTMIMKPTEFKKRLNKTIKLASIEAKKELLLQNNKDLLLSDNKINNQLTLLNQKSQDLMILSDEDIIQEDKYCYNGKFSHLNLIELNKQIEGVSNDEFKEYKKNDSERIKQECKYWDDKLGNHLDKVLNKVSETFEEEKQNKRECLDFLNSLESCD